MRLRNFYSDEEESETDQEVSGDDEPRQSEFADSMPGKSKKEIQAVEIKQDSCDFIYYVVCQNEEL